MSQCARILEVLTDGRPHTMQAIHTEVGFCRLNSRVSELRERGHDIRCTRDGSDYVYQLVSLGEPGTSSDDGGAPLRPTVAEPRSRPDGPHDPNPRPGSPSDDDVQLTLLAPDHRGAYSEAA